MSIRRLVSPLLLLTLTAGPVAAQGWATIIPGKTTSTDVEQAVGTAATVTNDGGGGTYYTYHDVLDAQTLIVKYLDDGRVANVQVTPATELREADMVLAFGELKKVVGRSGGGGKIVNYPLAGANVTYSANGVVSDVVVRGGVGTTGMSLEGLLRSTIGSGKSKKRN